VVDLRWASGWWWWSVLCGAMVGVVGKEEEEPRISKYGPADMRLNDKSGPTSTNSTMKNDERLVVGVNFVGGGGGVVDGKEARFLLGGRSEF